MLLSTDPNVAGETFLANLLRRSGFQAARHIMYVCMYVCMSERWAIRSGRCTATFNDLLCLPLV
jgi:hypothetical protein